MPAVLPVPGVIRWPVYSCDPTLGCAVVALLPRQAQAFHLWPTFERAAAAADAAVVVLDPMPAGAVQHLQGWSRGHSVPLIVMASRSYPHTSTLLRFGAHDLVWLEDAPVRLAETLNRASGDRYFQALARAMGSARELSPTLCRVLVTAVLARPPQTSVSRIASMVGVSRSTLWQHWRRSAGESTTLRLEDVLDWLALLRVAQSRTTGLSWSAAVRANGLCAETVARRAFRLTSLPPSELVGEAIAAAAHAFAAKICALFSVDVTDGVFPAWPLD